LSFFEIIFYYLLYCLFLIASFLKVSYIFHHKPIRYLTYMRKTNMKHTKIIVMTAAALLANITLAQAGEPGCTTCYQKIVTPPVYRSVNETVMVRPAQTIAHQTPAQFQTMHERVVVRPAQTYAREIPPQMGVVNETIMVRPAQTIARQTPAQMGSVAEQVMVSPARKEWQVTVDAHGRKIGCWVNIPAQYAVQHRTVVVRPAQVHHEVIPAAYETRSRQVGVRPAQVVHETTPAVYGTQARTVMVRPAQVHHQVIPAAYATRQRVEMVAPASASWQPIDGRRHGGHHSGGYHKNW
jgi:hypothetical protein